MDSDSSLDTDITAPLGSEAEEEEEEVRVERDMEKECNEEEQINIPSEAPSVVSLRVGFAPYEGYKRNKADKFPHEFDVRSVLRAEDMRDKLKCVPHGTEKNLIELQLERSDERMEELLDFGNELVFNIKAANEQQELLQTRKKNMVAAELQKAICDEAAEVLDLFDQVNKKWSEMSELREPMVIFEEMQKQRDNIAQLMASKDALIAKCQKELKKIREKYEADQQRQSKDVCFLVERIDDQIELFKQSYTENINKLQEAVDKERKNIHEAAKEKWDKLYDHLNLNEEKKMQIVKEKRKFYAEELEKITFTQEEITRATQIRLAKDAEMLELEIRKTRANILMNSEKIDYNYQVLQKRNEENVILNNQQKRRVAKLTENIVLMRRKLKNLKTRNKHEMEKLTQDIQKLHASISDLQMKADQFRKINRKKFINVWNMNFKEIRVLLTNVFDIDRILYEQQLARRWEKPEINFEKLDYIQLIENENKKAMKLSSAKAMKTNQQAKKLNHRQLNDILHKISDRAGFLLEERLLQILKPYTNEEKCLVKIENIFAALSITEIAVVTTLVKYFEPYSWCPNCCKGMDGKPFEFFNSFCQNDRKKGSIPTPEDWVDNTPCSNHMLVMEPSFVLTALNEFIQKEVNNKGKRNVKKSIYSTIESHINLLQFDEEEIRNYWQQFLAFMNDEKQKMWKTVEHGLNHYLEVLKKRSQLDAECVFLQNQNAELKHLLSKL